MNGKVLVLPLLLAVTLVLTACGGQGVPPGSGGSTAVGGGALSVQLTQGPPATMAAGTSVGLFATVFNDKNNAGVTWSCTPASACGTFSPTTTGYLIDTLYTAPAPAAPAVGSPILPAGQYAFVLQGYASFGMAGSIILDGNGNITGGEADASANGFYSTIPSITGTYAIDATGHGNISFSLNNTSCCGTFQQTHGLTVTSSSHAVIAEEDQFNGLTIGGVGSLDLQASAPNFTASQVNGGYSFTLTGFSSKAVKAAGGTGLNGSWAGVFTADGVGGISGGLFDASLAGGAPNYASTPFGGTFTSPDTFGRGTLTFQGVAGGSNAAYAYYIVTPEVLRLTVADASTAGFAGNTGSAWGQGSVVGAPAALAGSYVFGDLGFDVPGNAMGAAGQFTADGNGNVTTGIMDLNDSGNAGNLILGQSLAGSTYSISGSTRGTITGPGGQTYNVYLTDPNLNLLDPNNTIGGGGALLLETDTTFSAIGPVVPAQGNVGVTITATSVADSSQSASVSIVVGPALQGGYAILLSDQNSPPNSDGGLTGQFTAGTAGAFSGEGDFEGSGKNNATLTTGPLSGTFAADSNNPGRFTGSIVTNPPYPNGGTAAGTENVSLYLSNGAQGFVVGTDSVAPATGVIEQQTPSPAAAAAQRQHAQLQRSRPKNLLQTLGEQHGQLVHHAGSGHE